MSLECRLSTLTVSIYLLELVAENSNALHLFSRMNLFVCALVNKRSMNYVKPAGHKTTGNDHKRLSLGARALTHTRNQHFVTWKSALLSSVHRLGPHYLAEAHV